MRWVLKRYTASPGRILITSAPGQRRIVSGATSSRSPGAGLWDHAKQGREQGPVCPVQVRAAWLPPL